MKDATSDVKVCLVSYTVSIHASREGRDRDAIQEMVSRMVSIHASREGRDRYIAGCLPLLNLFQSTRPVKDATS